MNGVKENILQFIKTNGPVLPVEAARHAKIELMIASAFLSEIASEKKILISKAKIGGSPIYYLPGQEFKLSRLYEYLGEKPQKAYILLKEKKVLKDNSLEPWQRVALRELNDFARRIDVKIGEDTEIFWKWHLTNDEDAKREIVRIVKGAEVPIEQRKEVEERQQELKQETLQEVIKPKEELVKEFPEEKPKFKKQKRVEIDLGKKAKEYFENSKLTVLNTEIIKKGRDINYIVDVNSDLGKLMFFVKLLDKKKVNEGDLSLAVSKAKGKPVLFLSNGEMTKKAEKYFEDNLKGRVIFESL